MKKRIVSLLLCLALLCSVIPAFADIMKHNYVELKSSKSDHFYTLPSELSNWEDIEVTSYPGRQLDDVPLVRGGKLLIPANYEGVIVLSSCMEDTAISADKASSYYAFTVYVKPATAPKLSAKIVDKKTIEVTWPKIFDDVSAIVEDNDIVVMYAVGIVNADTGEEINYDYYTPNAHKVLDKTYATVTETKASFALKGRNFHGEKYNIKEGTNLEVILYVVLINGIYIESESFSASSASSNGTIYTTASTKLSVPVTPVIYNPVTNFNIGRKLDKRNAVGKTVTLVRGVKEKFRIFGVQPSDATEPQFIWKSMNPNVVSVDNNGVITAKKLGTAVIKVKAVNTNVVKSFKIKVVRPADKK